MQSKYNQKTRMEALVRKKPLNACCWRDGDAEVTFLFPHR